MPELKSKYQRFRQKKCNNIRNRNKSGSVVWPNPPWLILLSVLLVMETVTEFDLKYHSYLVLLRWIITVLFTIEYIFRIFQSTSPGNTCPVSTVLLIYLQFYPCICPFSLWEPSILAVVRSFETTQIIQNIKPPLSLQVNHYS
jgi:voltage-gated potassium channel